jgi:hypothetical protein
MNVTETKRTLTSALPPRKSILLIGDHGNGKSQVVAQSAQYLSEKLGKPFFLTDFRVSQVEVGDLIGHQRILDNAQITRSVYVKGKLEEQTVNLSNVTVNSLADWFPQDPDSHGFLFFDELFRAPRDILNALMEVSLDYRYHFKPLPMGWRVVAASNDNLDIYAGNMPDPAQFDRWFVIKFNPTVEEWVTHAKTIGVHRAIIQYIAKMGEKDLDPPKNMEQGTIYQSRRSWVSLSDTIKYMAANGEDPFKDPDFLFKICLGWVGPAVTDHFISYVKTNFRIYSSKDILDDWNDEKIEAFKDMEMTEIGFYSSELADFLAKEKKLNEVRAKNLGHFVRAVPKEMAQGFFSDFSKKNFELCSKWYLETDKSLTDYIMALTNKKLALASKRRNESMQVTIGGKVWDLRVLHINARCSDLCFAELKDETGRVVVSHDGYVPNIMPGKHYGDYVQLDIDLETGKILNWRVPTKADIEDEIYKKEWKLDDEENVE